ncbi:MAG: hypothetical protein LBN00_03015 [Oscillospiraceae bacterium]|jgi:adenylate kinase family enzyme|nr:hypothetical protein [Oscillospiraceae bacterium]
MERIWICGCAGSGKTTLANFIGGKRSIPVYHRDSITWDENDNVRSEERQIAMVRDIAKQDKWIFEGARFTASKIDGRLDNCDTIIHLNINRFICVYRGIKRGLKQAKMTSIPEKDKQPFYFEHIKGVLIGYPQKRKQRDDVFETARKKGIDVVVLKKRKDVREFCNKL